MAVDPRARRLVKWLYMASVTSGLALSGLWLTTL